MRKIAGFNLIEVMIAVTIIGILTAISLPIYSQHLIHARRLEAEINLLKLANALEKYNTLNNTYQNVTINQLGLAEKIANNQYWLHIAKATDTSFSLEAIPLGKQAELDQACAILLLNSAGHKTITGTGNITECW